MIYRVKHLPTGLYYQPRKHDGSHLSKKGKIYQTKINGVFDSSNIKSGIVRVYSKKGNSIHKQTDGKLQWQVCPWASYTVKVDTLLSDWVVEEIK